MSRLARPSRRMLSLAPLALLLLATSLAVTATPSEAVAQERSLQNGPVVRRMLLYRSSKLEVTPMVGTSLGELYQRDLLVGVAARYFLTNAFGLGLNVAAAPVHLNTSIASEFEQDDPRGSRDVHYSTTTLLTDFHIEWVALPGKLNLLGDNIMHFDVHLELGVGGALRSSDAPSDELSGFAFGPVAAIGSRIFVKDNIAVTLRFADYFYSDVDAQRGATDVDPKFQHHFIGMAGVSFFLPGDVRVSR